MATVARRVAEAMGDAPGGRTGADIESAFALFPDHAAEPATSCARPGPATQQALHA